MPRFNSWLHVVILVMLPGMVMAATDIEIFRYSDAKGRAVFTDRAIVSPSYKLVWRTTLSKLDASFERAPHLPVAIGTGRARNRIWRRKAEFAPMIAKVAREIQISSHLLHAVVQAESGYNPNARSPAGAMGLMQLMPATAKRYGVDDILDPEQNLTGGAQYLKDLLELFDNNLKLVLAAYNAGEGAVLRNGNHIPPYPETREYVRKVIGNFRAQRGQTDS